MPDKTRCTTCDGWSCSCAKEDAPTPGTFVESGGCRVAAIREGASGVEIKHNQDGTCDLTFFWYGADYGRTASVAARSLSREELIALRRAIDAMLIQIAGSADSGE